MDERSVPAPVATPASPRGRSSTRHHILLHVAIVAFGGSGLFAKLIDLAPGPLVLGRAAIAAAVIAVVAKASGRSLRPNNLGDLAVFAGMGAVLAVHWIAFFRAIQVSTVSIAVLSVATFPVFTTVFEAAMSRRRPRTIDLALGVLAFVGVGIIVGSPDPASPVTIGVFWGVAAAALFAGLTVVNERLVVGYSGLAIAFYQFGFAALVLAPLFAGAVVSVTATELLLLLLLGSIFTGMPHTLFLSSMRAISSSTASLSASLEPIYGILLAWLLLNERPGPGIMLGGAVVLTAVVLGTRYRR